MNLMKKELTKIVQEKKKQKNNLTNLKNEYLSIIYKGVSKGKDFNKIRDELIKQTINQKKKGIYSPKMLKASLKVAANLKQSTSNMVYVRNQTIKTYDPKDKSDGNLLALWTYHLMNHRKVDKEIGKYVSKECDKKEADLKEEAINLTLDTNRQENKQIVKRDSGYENLKLFYLASKHKDSATDHKDYQGKVYIDEKWVHLNIPDNVANAIKEYINRNNVKTMQWVIGKPVWFITRPNCRHYFKDLTLKETLENSKTSLIERYGLSTPIGDRRYMQTLPDGSSKNEKEALKNAQLLLECYEERLYLHEMLYKDNPTELLKNAILKDKMLIKKWKEYISKRRTV